MLGLALPGTPVPDVADGFRANSILLGHLSWSASLQRVDATVSGGLTNHVNFDSLLFWEQCARSRPWAVHVAFVFHCCLVWCSVQDQGFLFIEHCSYSGTFEACTELSCIVKLNRARFLVWIKSRVVSIFIGGWLLLFFGKTLFRCYFRV